MEGPGNAGDFGIPLKGAGAGGEKPRTTRERKGNGEKWSCYCRAAVLGGGMLVEGGKARARRAGTGLAAAAAAGGY